MREFELRPRLIRCAPPQGRGRRSVDGGPTPATPRARVCDWCRGLLWRWPVLVVAAVVAERGIAKIRPLFAEIACPLYSGCCGARSQLYFHHIIVSQLVDSCLRSAGALLHGSRAWFGHLIRPGTLRYSVPQPERRKSFSLSDKCM